VLGLGAGAVGQADDREARHAALEMRLHLDSARLEPDESVGDGAREHTNDATSATPTAVCRSTN
jgi:hypothetical protein